MKRGTPQHPKMKDLATRLGIPRAHAVGIMEMLWHFTAKYAPTGDIGKFGDAAIASEVEWTNEPAKLVSGLVKARWVDRHDECRLYVHDWHEHAEDAVQIALARKTTLFANGAKPNMSRLSKKERKALETAYLRLVPTPCPQNTHKNAQNTHCPPLPSPPFPLPLSSGEREKVAPVPEQKSARQIKAEKEAAELVKQIRGAQ